MTDEESKKLLNKYKNATVRQHYVSKRYLKKWSKEGKRIFARLNKTNKWRYLGLDDACAANGFYRIDHIFNDLELKLLEGFYENEEEPIKRTCVLEISAWQKEASVLKIKECLPRDEHSLVDSFASQSGEDYQTYFENNFYDIVDILITNNDFTFLNNKDVLSKFVIGLMSQYFRTSKMKDKIVKALNDIVVGDIKEKVNFDALWHMTSRIMAITFSVQLLRSSPGLTILSSDKSNFMTSDQPVFRPNSKIVDADVDSFFLIYPISPHKCILFPTKESKTICVDNKTVNKINGFVINESYRFLFLHK